jgi:fumarate reductase flavoprotein subunit
LPECLVFGARAGRAAAEYAAAAGIAPPVIEAQATDEVRRLERDLLSKGPGTESIAAIRDEMQSAMEDAAGIFRTGPEMAKGAESLAELQQRVGNVGLADTSRSFNTELMAALELANMLDISECILQAGMQREESRGAHQRTDFPARDDQRFLTHLLVHRNPDGTARVERLPVTITRWPPGERVYGR